MEETESANITNDKPKTGGLIKDLWSDDKKRRKGLIGILSAVIIISLIWIVSMVSGNWRGGEEGKEATGSSTLALTETPEKELTEEASPSATPILTLTKKATLTPTKTPTPMTGTQATATPTNTSTPTPTNTADTQAPTFTSIGGPSEADPATSSNFCFPMTLTDNVSSAGSIYVRYALDPAALSDWKTDYAPCYSGVGNGSHTFRVQAKDAAGNETGVQTRTFTVALATATSTPTPTVTTAPNPTTSETPAP